MRKTQAKEVARNYWNQWLQRIWIVMIHMRWPFSVATHPLFFYRCLLKWFCCYPVLSHFQHWICKSRGETSGLGWWLYRLVVWRMTWLVFPCRMSNWWCTQQILQNWVDSSFSLLIGLPSLLLTSFLPLVRNRRSMRRNFDEKSGKFSSEIDQGGRWW